MQDKNLIRKVDIEFHSIGLFTFEFKVEHIGILDIERG